jgi:hypothetical protein
MLNAIRRFPFLALAALMGLLRPFPLVARSSVPNDIPPLGRSAPPRRRRASTFYTPNGKRECARRRRQIEAGRLRVTQ